MAGLYDYKVAEQLKSAPFDALIMAAAMKADRGNLAKLEFAFPEQVDEAMKRWNAPGGKLEGER